LFETFQKSGAAKQFNLQRVLLMSCITNWFSESSRVATMSRKEENNEVDIVNLLHDLGQVFGLDVSRDAAYADHQERQQQQQV
jgi:hypothetical protein